MSQKNEEQDLRSGGNTAVPSRRHGGVGQHSSSYDHPDPMYDFDKPSPRYEHPPTSECEDLECTECGTRDCPHGEPLHYHHDGCPACHVSDREAALQVRAIYQLKDRVHARWKAEMMKPAMNTARPVYVFVNTAAHFNEVVDAEIAEINSGRSAKSVAQRLRQRSGRDF